MNQALIVLGMHRSGTSAVAGALAKLGAAAPANLMPEHPDNPKGYWESAPLARLNDRILEAAESSWHDWRPISDAWFDTPDAKNLTRVAAEALKLEFPDDGPIVLKDPRICRLFPLWRSALDQAGYAPIIATPLRRPVEVAASLAKRDDFSMGRAYLIWLRHVLEAERTTRDMPRILFRWSDFMNDWRAVLARLDREAGGHLPRRNTNAEAEVDAFLDTDLRRQKHSSSVSSDAPTWIAPAFDALTNLIGRPDNKHAESALDEIRQDFDRTASIYGPVFAGVETEHHQFQRRFQDQLDGLKRGVETAREEARKSERARVETEAGWHAERKAREVLQAEFEAVRSDRSRVVEALQATEKARLDTEAGWTAERKAREVMDLELSTERKDKARIKSVLKTSEEALAAAMAAAQTHAGRIEAMLAAQASLEQEFIRVETLHQDAEARGRDLSGALEESRRETDLERSEKEAARTELRNLVVRRRRQPVETAWAILRGRDG